MPALFTKPYISLNSLFKVSENLMMLEILHRSKCLTKIFIFLFFSCDRIYVFAFNPFSTSRQASTRVAPKILSLNDSVNIYNCTYTSLSQFQCKCFSYSRIRPCYYNYKTIQPCGAMANSSSKVFTKINNVYLMYKLTNSHLHQTVCNRTYNYCPSNTFPHY